jgi:hypothetical protein
LAGKFRPDCIAVVAPGDEIAAIRMEQHDVLGFSGRTRDLSQSDQNY